MTYEDFAIVAALFGDKVAMSLVDDNREDY